MVRGVQEKSFRRGECSKAERKREKGLGELI